MKPNIIEIKLNSQSTTDVIIYFILKLSFFIPKFIRKSYICVPIDLITNNIIDLY